MITILSWAIVVGAAAVFAAMAAAGAYYADAH
jgi:hypothetical protein